MKEEFTWTKEFEFLSNIYIENVQVIMRSLNLLGSQVHCISPQSIQQFSDVIFRRLPLLIERRNVRVIVMDSIAALFRVEYSSNELSHRCPSKHSCSIHLCDPPCV